MTQLLKTHSTCLLLLALTQAAVHADELEVDPQRQASSQETLESAADADSKPTADDDKTAAEGNTADDDNPVAEVEESADSDTESSKPATSPDEPAPLSVAPLDQIEYPDDRPEWIESPTQLEALPHRWTVVSGPSETIQQSLEDLQVLKRASIETYLKSLSGSQGRFDYFPMTDSWIENELVVRRYEGEVTQEGLTLYEHAVEIQIDRQTEAAMRAALTNVEVRQRLGAMGVVVATGLFGLICSSALVGTISRRVQRRESVQASSI